MANTPRSESSPAPPAASGSGAGARLAQDIVIESAGDAAVGSQAIAPDYNAHTARPAPTAAAAPPPPQLAPRSGGLVQHAAQREIEREIERLLYLQSELLDAKRWQDYIDLFTDDGWYWMPVTPEQTEWEGSPSIFAEDKAMMEVRMGRVSHPTAWSQVPAWSTSHVIGNVVIESEASGVWTVRSRFHMMELRRDTVRHFGGTYRHTLVREAGRLRIQLQRVDMFNAQAPFDYVLQVWV